ncbi:MAG: hypothetical protein HOO93_05690 [Methyloglobulus sp.]|nr:hypothetical protein [Methyloglobulus sp.]
METKSSQLLNIRYPTKTAPKEEPKFPTARYFQIHFEYVEDQIAETQRCLVAMQSQITELSERVIQLATEFNHKTIK